MYPQHYFSQINVHTRIWALIPVIVFGLAGCQPYSWFPAQDCGVAHDVHLAGLVQDRNGDPVDGATIVIRSKRQTECRNSVPIDDIVLLSDENGSFEHTIPFIAEDDSLEILVTVKGYQDYSIDYLTYADFEESILITMSADN